MLTPIHSNVPRHYTGVHLKMPPVKMFDSVQSFLASILSDLQSTVNYVALIVPLDSRWGQWESYSFIDGYYCLDDGAFVYLESHSYYVTSLNFFTLRFRALGRNHISFGDLFKLQSFPK